MNELVERFDGNPILSPKDVKPSRPDFEVECLLNPGAFEFKGRTGLLLRVAERPAQEPGWISTPVLDAESPGGVRIVRVHRDHPELNAADPRVLVFRDKAYLTTLSHLRLAWSEDGRKFVVDEKPTLMGEGALEEYGIEDCRVQFIEGRYYLTYTAVSSAGHGVGMISTADWVDFARHGMIFTAPNKDCALFPERIGGKYFAMHRPSTRGLGGNYIWIAESPDLLHWGDHRCIARTRTGHWDEGRVGAGASPIETERGWLCIYHGANKVNQYCLGLMLLEREDPSRVIARPVEPIIRPTAEYELRGFLGRVIFTNGHVIEGDRITMYYGASDQVICGATMSLERLLRSITSG